MSTCRLASAADFLSVEACRLAPYIPISFSPSSARRTHQRLDTGGTSVALWHQYSILCCCQVFGLVDILPLLPPSLRTCRYPFYYCRQVFGLVNIPSAFAGGCSDLSISLCSFTGGSSDLSISLYSFIGGSSDLSISLCSLPADLRICRYRSAFAGRSPDLSISSALCP